MSEDLKPIAQDEPVQEQSATVSETVAASAADEVKEETLTQSESEEDVDYSTMSLKELVDIMQGLLDEVDMQKLYKNAESIKAAFYKTLKKENPKLIFAHLLGYGDKGPEKDWPGIVAM